MTLEAVLALDPLQHRFVNTDYMLHKEVSCLLHPEEKLLIPADQYLVIYMGRFALLPEIDI